MSNQYEQETPMFCPFCRIWVRIDHSISQCERDIQTVRLLLMMYRQGWLDARDHLLAQTMKVDREILRKYKELS